MVLEYPNYFWIEYVKLALATGFGVPFEYRSTSPTIKLFPNLRIRALAVKSDFNGLRIKSILQLVVTAVALGPIFASTAI